MDLSVLRPRAAVPSRIDVGIAVALAVLVIGGTLNVDGSPAERPTDALAVVLGAMAAGAVVLRLPWPLAMLAVTAGAVAVYDLRDHPGGPIYLTVPVAMLAFFATVTDRRTAYVGAAGLIAVLAGAGFVADGGVGVHELVMTGWVAAAAFAADSLRGRAERAAAERAHRADEAARALTEERLRIARDLHDGVAHSLATINVQSGVAARLLDREPDVARDALEAIRRASSDVLDQMGAILGLLRRDEPAERRSSPGIGAVGDLVGWARANGVTVDADIGGAAHDDLRPAVADAAYRVAQEALTNVVRHAPGARARLFVGAGHDGAFTVRVVDDGAGRPPRPVGAGLGLIGMGERVDASGGGLVTGPVPTGGFRVVATWPAP